MYSKISSIRDLIYQSYLHTNLSIFPLSCYYVFGMMICFIKTSLLFEINSLLISQILRTCFSVTLSQQGMWLIYFSPYVGSINPFVTAVDSKNLVLIEKKKEEKLPFPWMIRDDASSKTISIKLIKSIVNWLSESIC